MPGIADEMPNTAVFFWVEADAGAWPEADWLAGRAFPLLQARHRVTTAISRVMYELARRISRT